MATQRICPSCKTPQISADAAKIWKCIKCGAPVPAVETGNEQGFTEFVSTLKIKDETKWGLANAYSGEDEKSKGIYLGIIEALWDEKVISEADFINLEWFQGQKNSPN